MRKNIILAAFSVVLMLAASCQKTVVNKVKGNGYLSFSEFSLGLDEELITKASAAGNNYTIIVRDADGNDITKEQQQGLEDQTEKDEKAKIEKAPEVKF